MAKRRMFISDAAFKCIRSEKLKLIIQRKKNPSKYKYKRIDDAFVVDKIVGVR